ncbi:MAG: tryptophan synthase subunit alpha [Gammaproteobacteria bacterium]|nr:tryptophan synthase subunit alpha [Gammaproteobacteria bacterium]MDE0443053.1 tryptophan synthase subunit alpha [Gammaproteobacteria bacterium]
MSRLGERFETLAADGRKALNTYIVAGDPSPEVTVPAMHALVRGGADLIELGVPFSDPEAEGPTIQAGIERALAHDVTLADVLDMMSAFRSDDRDTPVVLMGYLNPFLRMGYEAFCKRAAHAGVDGIIVVNLPAEEAGTFRGALHRRHMDLVLLVAPTTTAERAAYIAAQGSGFLYYVSYKGVTGARRADARAVAKRLTEVRAAARGLPVLVGFGIKDGASAAGIAPHADGVVVGSALVETMGCTAAASIPDRLQAQVREIRDALN